MSEVKPLNLSGGYNPLAEVDRESYADKTRKNSQAVMQKAMGRYQMQAAQQNMQNQETMQRADRYFGENYTKFSTSTASIKDPKSWSFNTGDTRDQAFAQYKQEVGGNYSAFNEAWTMKQNAEQESLKKSMQRWRTEVGDDQEFGKQYSVFYDSLSDIEKNNLMGNANQDLFTSLNQHYIDEDKRGGFLEKYGLDAGKAVGVGYGVYQGYKMGSNVLGGSKEILDETRKLNSRGSGFTKSFENLQSEGMAENKKRDINKKSMATKARTKAKKIGLKNAGFSSSRQPEKIKGIFDKRGRAINERRLNPREKGKNRRELKKSIDRIKKSPIGKINNKEGKRALLKKMQGKMTDPVKKKALAAFVARQIATRGTQALTTGWIPLIGQAMTIASIGYSAYEIKQFADSLMED
tara:strand:+ start:504 stop:1727 length:1224 start_codon:yes stop_codon:yes gene_type:complete